MAREFSKKEVVKFRLTLLFLPVVPDIILYFKHHYTAAGLLTGFCWGLLSILLVFAMFKKTIDEQVHTLCMKIISALGNFLSFIALSFIYIFALLPTGILAKLLKRDRLRLSKPNLKTYRIPYHPVESSYENQF